MSIIKIKRSGVSGSPSSLGQGELAYSYLSGTEANGGDRLYIGTGVETGGNAANIEVIGGVYFTSKLDHTPGTLTANSAVIVDGDSKVNVFNVDNIRLDGNAITSTDTNGNITITPNGSGNIVLDGQNWPQADGSANQYLKTNGLGQLAWAEVPSGDFTIAGDSGSDTFITGQTLTFTGNTGITTSASNNEITFVLDDTAVTAGSYGNTTSIPTFTVDAQGRLTAAGTASISTDLDIAGDSGTDTISLAVDTLTINGDTGITTVANSSGIFIDLDDTAVTPGSYGDANTVATLTVDQQGRLTAAGTADVDHDALLNFVANEHIDHSSVSLSAGNGLTGGGDITASRTFTVGAGNGITVNADDVAVNAQAGLTANSSGLFVETSGDSTLVANSSGLFVDDSTIDHDALLNFVANEHIDHSGVTLTAGDGLSGGGDITASRSFAVVGGTGVTANSTGVHIGQAVETTSDVTFNDVTVNGSLFSNDVTASEVVITGNLVVQGITTTVNSNEVNIGDAILNLNSDLGSGIAPSENAGISVNRGSSANVEFVWDETVDKWTIGSGTLVAGTVEADLTGDVTGNADTASALASAVQIELTGDVTGSVSFDGSANVSITATVAANSIALGTDTTGDYVESVDITAGTGLTISGNSGESAAVTIAGVNATTSVKGVASFNSDNFTVSSGAVSIAAIDGGTY